MTAREQAIEAATRELRRILCVKTTLDGHGAMNADQARGVIADAVDAALSAAAGKRRKTR